jgi:hypothetical protein
MRSRVAFLSGILILSALLTPGTAPAQDFSSVPALQAPLETGKALYGEGHFSEAEAAFQEAIALQSSTDDITEARHQTEYHPRRMAEALIARTPEDYHHDFGGDPLDFAFEVVTYRGPDQETEVELTYAVPIVQLGDTKDGKGEQTFLLNQFTLRDSAFAPVAHNEAQFGPLPRRTPSDRQPTASQAYLIAQSFLATPDAYTLAVELKDQATDRIGVYKKPVILSDYHGDGLLISDVKLATHIAPQSGSEQFARHGLSFAPNPGRLYRQGQPVYLYYEIYNLHQDEEGRTQYQMRYEITPKGMPHRQDARPAEQKASTILVFDGSGSSEEQPAYTSLDTSELAAGEYDLSVVVTDQLSGQSAARSINFMVIGR